jgi:flagellar hook protein FlgE
MSLIKGFSTALTAIKANSQLVDVTSNNISNVNTVGFKGQRADFADLFSQTIRSASAPSPLRGGLDQLQIGSGVQVDQIITDENQGSLNVTGGVTDMAIQGEGFFRLMDATGNDVRYTRAGDFHLDRNGDLIGQSGFFVCGRTDTNLDGVITAADSITKINIPSTARSVSIGQDGTVSYIDPAGVLQTAGQIVTAEFNNPAGLERLGSNMWSVAQDSGPENVNFPTQNGSGSIIQGSLESSNVDLASEFVHLVEGQRGFQAATRVVTTGDDMLQELMNMKR